MRFILDFILYSAGSKLVLLNKLLSCGTRKSSRHAITFERTIAYNHKMTIKSTTTPISRSWTNS